MKLYARLTHTSAQLLGVFLFALLATACGEIDPNETIDTEEATETTTQELNGINTYCGYSCPPTETFVGRTCDRGCSDFGECLRDDPPQLDTSNAVMCRPRATGTASIWGSPSQVRIQPGRLGTSRICWRTQNMPRGSTAWIKVVHDNNPEQLFASSRGNGVTCQNAPWIQIGHSYRFSVKTQRAGGVELASTTVRGVRGIRPIDIGLCGRPGQPICP